jgi:hypothetical protein
MRASVEYRIANGDVARSSTLAHATNRASGPCNPGGAPRVEAAARVPGGDQRRDADDPGERADGFVAGAEHLHPDVQEEVVERRRAVLAERLAQLRER